MLCCIIAVHIVETSKGDTKGIYYDNIPNVSQDFKKIFYLLIL